MQRFLIGPGIGGARLTKAAVEFIIRKNNIGQITAFEDDGVGNVFVSYSDPNRLTQGDGFYTEWYRMYIGTHKNMPLSDIKPSDSVELPINSEIRDLALMYMVNSTYDSLLSNEYVAELDRLNNGSELRIIDMPEGYHCHIATDPENGCEYVEEYKRLWFAERDADLFTKQQIKRFACTYCEGLPLKNVDQFNVGEYMDLLITVRGDRAVVYSKLNKQFAFLKKARYYTYTDDHPKEWFEIIGDLNNKYQTAPIFYDMDSVNDYCEMVNQLVGSASSRETTGTLGDDK